MRILLTLLCLGALSALGALGSETAGRSLFTEYGVCTSMKNYESVRRSGYDYIETGVRGLLKPESSDAEVVEEFQKIKEAKLRILACNSFLPAKFKCVGPEANHEEILQYAEVTFRRAKELGVKGIVFGSAKARKMPEGVQREDAVKQFVDLLKKMAPLAEAQGVEIWIEPLNTEEDNFINTMVQGKEIVAAVDHPSVGLTCDLFHMARNGEGPENIIIAGKYIRHCHIAEKEKRTAPGMKGDDFTPYLKALRKVGYHAEISMECGWDDFEKRLPLALDYLKQQVSDHSTTKDGMLTFNNMPLGSLRKPLVMRTFMPFAGLEPSVLPNHHKGAKSPKYNPALGKDVEGEYLPISGLPAAFGVNYGKHLSYCWDTVECRLMYAWSEGFLDMENYWGQPERGNRQSFGYVPELRGDMFYRAQGSHPVTINGTSVSSPQYLGYAVKGDLLDFIYKVDGAEIHQQVRPAKQANRFEMTLTLQGSGKLGYREEREVSVEVISDKEVKVVYQGAVIARYEAAKAEDILKGKATAKMGEKIFAKMACITCHSLDGSKSHGPTLLGLHGSKRAITGLKEKVLADDAYIKESINNPNVKVVEGYPENYMPVFKMNPKEVESLLLFIKTLKKD
ncbi:hypothetical protein Rhal01_02272 [Rubritalea halochordaticola]|uniref:Cytochrome c domain-containing protein n=1 Tax=Rubritalea halochordaticola TaxID=714537 RepID=A0ABP9V077_9BACT